MRKRKVEKRQQRAASKRSEILSGLLCCFRRQVTATFFFLLFCCSALLCCCFFVCVVCRATQTKPSRWSFVLEVTAGDRERFIRLLPLLSLKMLQIYHPLELAVMKVLSFHTIWLAVPKEKSLRFSFSHSAIDLGSL